MHYVGLKPGHCLTIDEAGAVKEMELSTPEERWPLDAVGTPEVYFKGTKSECFEFIKSIEKIKAELGGQFEIFEE